MTEQAPGGEPYSSEDPNYIAIPRAQLSNPSNGDGQHPAGTSAGVVQEGGYYATPDATFVAGGKGRVIVHGILSGYEPDGPPAAQQTGGEPQRAEPPNTPPSPSS
jgi:hypothetical protein